MNPDRPDLPPGDESPTRAGFVVLVGLPNVGKSTLLNALVGEHLSIATPKAQTTWQRVAGIRTEESVQMIFVDTPGLISSLQLFHRSMAIETERAVAEADVVIGLLDGGARKSREELKRFHDLLARAARPAAIAVNKADLRRFDPASARRLARDLQLPLYIVSARTGSGLEPLLEFVASQLPEGPFLYPADHLASAPARFFVQELIRESVFERYRQEIPYAVAVRIEEFREGEDPVYIAASLHVERKSQKGMLIGKGGTGIKSLGATARGKIEHFLGRRVYLDLWVKVSHGWRRRRKGLAMFGYVVPDSEA
ncbi:MAG: GTPase Era [Gemmatimonadetes bacterium]|nr:GTPase Era [Gemmatimonadota bacterium]